MVKIEKKVMSETKINLTNLEKIPQISVDDWGKTLIVAPHPDDESLGCGGAIKLLRNNNSEVYVLVLSDGTLSHPNSKKFPAVKLRDLREKEIIEALKVLNVEKEKIRFFRYKDRAVPNENSENWNEIIKKCREYFYEIKPQTVFVPWRRDPHPDHRAAYKIVSTIKKTLANLRIIEYPIWLWEIAQTEDAPQIGEVSAHRLDVSSVKNLKRQAIYKHNSQIAGLIDDDPEGFQLSPEILENFLTDWEIYFEAV